MEWTPLLAPPAQEALEAAEKLPLKGKRWWLPLMLPVALYVTGVCVLMHLEGWPALVSTYVITQMVTTIGYGEFTVTSNASKLFMSAYSMLCLLVLAYYYNLTIGRFVQWESDALRKYFRKLEVEYDDEVHDDKEAVKKYKQLNEAVAGFFLFLCSVVVGTLFFRLAEHCTCSYGIQAVPNCDGHSFASCRDSGGFVKSWVDSFYMASVSLTTVGFGDFQPRTVLGRVFAIIWMLVGVCTTSVALVSASSFFFNSGKEKHFASIEKDPAFDEDTFRKVDRDGNGSLSRDEFITYTLVKYGLVDEDLLEDVHDQYDKLDEKGDNAVTFEMIRRRRCNNGSH